MNQIARKRFENVTKREKNNEKVEKEGEMNQHSNNETPCTL